MTLGTLVLHAESDMHAKSAGVPAACAGVQRLAWIATSPGSVCDPTSAAAAQLMDDQRPMQARLVLERVLTVSSCARLRCLCARPLIESLVYYHG